MIFLSFERYFCQLICLVVDHPHVAASRETARDIHSLLCIWSTSTHNAVRNRPLQQVSRYSDPSLPRLWSSPCFPNAQIHNSCIGSQTLLLYRQPSCCACRRSGLPRYLSWAFLILRYDVNLLSLLDMWLVLLHAGFAGPHEWHVCLKRCLRTHPL